jgi:ABC-2 type transport system permease protein
MFNDIYTVWLREMKRFLRARSRIITSLAMPFFWLAFIGVGFGSSVQIPGMSYLNFLAPGIIGMILLFTSIFTGISVIWDRQFGFLKEMLVAPVSRTSIFLGKALGGTTIAVINALIMLFVALALGIIPLGIGLATAIVFMILISLCFVSIGLIIASRMRSMEGFQMIMSFLIMPVFFVSGAIFPLQNTPQWMQFIAHMDPLTYGVDGLRNALINTGIFSIWIDLGAMMIICTGLILVGGYLFRKSAL